MRLYSTLLGLPIFCDEGIKVGVIKDILFCGEKRELLGFMVEEKGIFSSMRFISTEKIKKVNETFLVTKNKECIKAFKSFEQFCNVLNKSVKFGINSFIYNKDYEFLGQIKDILFDLDNNKIEAYIISKGYFDDMTPQRVVINSQIEFDEKSEKYRTVDY